MEALREYGFSLSFTATYASLHEMGHYLVARALGYQAKIISKLDPSDMALMRTFIEGPIKPQDVPLILIAGTAFSLAVILAFLIVARATSRTFLAYGGFAAADASFNLLTPVGDALWPILDLDTSALLFYIRYALLFALIISLINDMRRREENDEWEAILNSSFS